MGDDYRDPEELERLYHEEGLTLREMADRFGVGKSTLIYHMDKHDIQRRLPGHRADRAIIVGGHTSDQAD